MLFTQQNFVVKEYVHLSVVYVFLGGKSQGIVYFCNVLVIIVCVNKLLVLI